MTAIFNIPATNINTIPASISAGFMPNNTNSFGTISNSLGFSNNVNFQNNGYSCPQHGFSISSPTISSQSSPVLSSNPQGSLNMTSPLQINRKTMSEGYSLPYLNPSKTMQTSPMVKELAKVSLDQRSFNFGVVLSMFNRSQNMEEERQGNCLGPLYLERCSNFGQDNMEEEMQEEF